MAEEEETPQVVEEKKKLPIIKLTSAEQAAEAIKADDNVTLLAYVNVDCDLCKDNAIPCLEEICVLPENETVKYYMCDVNESPEAAKAAKVSTLPFFAFYHNNEFIESFSGANMDKLKLMQRGAIHKRNEILKARAAAAEEEARIAAQKAAAEAAENQENQ